MPGRWVVYAMTRHRGDGSVAGQIRRVPEEHYGRTSGETRFEVVGECAHRHRLFRSALACGRRMVRERARTHSPAR